VVEGADELRDLLGILDDTFDPGMGQDMVIWQARPLLAVWTAEGRQLQLRLPCRCDGPDDGPRAA